MKLEGKPKEQVQKLIGSLPVGKLVNVTLGKHRDTTRLLQVKLATQKEIKNNGGNLPDKVAGEDGKDHTPAICSIFFESFILDVVLEDIDLNTLIGGARFTFPWGTIEITTAE